MHRRLFPIAPLLAAVFLCACDTDLFGPKTKEIAGGYRLKKARNSDEFSLTIPYQSGGLIIDEIGWKEPYIVARGAGSQFWDLINTARAQHTRVSDNDLKADAAYSAIEMKTPVAAWNELGRRSPVW